MPGNGAEVPVPAQRDPDGLLRCKEPVSRMFQRIPSCSWLQWPIVLASDPVSILVMVRKPTQLVGTDAWVTICLEYFSKHPDLMNAQLEPLHESVNLVVGFDLGIGWTERTSHEVPHACQPEAGDCEGTVVVRKLRNEGVAGLHVDFWHGRFLLACLFWKCVLLWKLGLQDFIALSKKIGTPS